MGGRPRLTKSASGGDAFTLVELMVAGVVLVILLAIIFSITSQTSRLWKSTNSKITAFQNARAAFEALTRNLSQATLNHYYDYYDQNWQHVDAGGINGTAANYGRFSELEFVSGPAAGVFTNGAAGKVSHALFFQAPLGKVDDTNLAIESASMMNALGYYVEFGGRSQYDQIPKFLQGAAGSDRKAFRLIEWTQPAEKLEIYDKSFLSNKPWDWFARPVAAGGHSRVMADNVVALVVLPMSQVGDLAFAPQYFYDSTPASGYDSARSYLLPALLQVTLVAIDEDSAQRLRQVYGDTAAPLIPSGAFSQASQYESDLKKLVANLNGENGGPRLNYRVFSTVIATKEGQ